MNKVLIDTLLECRAKFAQYADEHKAKASRFRRDAAEVPCTKLNANFKEADALREQAKASEAKAKTNFDMVATVDEAIKQANAEAYVEETAFKAGFEVAAGNDFSYANAEDAWITFLGKQA